MADEKDKPNEDVAEGAGEPLATQAGLEEVAARIESHASDVDERFTAVEEKVATLIDLADAHTGQIVELAKEGRGSGDAEYVKMLEDKIAVLEWAVEHSAGVNLAEARRRVLSPAAVETPDPAGSDDEVLRGAERP